MGTPAKTAANRNSLFPILPTGLTGLAKLAAEASHADDGHLVEFRSLQVRSMLNRSISKRQLWLDYSINPYRGCEFGCRYCYARYTHEFLPPKPGTALGCGPSSDGSAQQGSPAQPINLLDPEAFER